MSKKVLIVEDAKMIQKVLSGIFTTNGYEVVGIAENGLEAIDKYFDLRPDLTTMDIRMPKMDGLQALKEIRFKEDTAVNKVNSKIMMVTSVEDDVRAVKVAGLYGASDYIKKPFKTDELLDRVDRVVNQGYNFVKESLHQTKEETSEKVKEDEPVSSYVIEGEEHQGEGGVIDPALREQLDELEEALNKIANELINEGATLPEDKIGDYYDRFNDVAAKLEFEHLQESASLARATASYMQRMQSCGLSLYKNEIDLVLNAIDTLEDAIEYITDNSSENGILDTMTGRNMMKILKRF